MPLGFQGDEKVAGLALFRPDPIFYCHGALGTPLILCLPTWQLLEEPFPLGGEQEA